MDDGTEGEAGPGDVGSIEPGHDTGRRRKPAKWLTSACSRTREATAV
jgi:hypothetical protein